MVVRPLIDTLGPLPITKTFHINSGVSAALFVSGSVWANNDLVKLSIDVLLDRNPIGTPMIFANKAEIHLAFVPMIIPVVLNAGNHVITLAAKTSTSSDKNDNYNVVLMY